MNRLHPHSVPPSSNSTHLSAGFTLTEIVLALGIIATVFVALLGLLPAGLDASRKAADSTAIALIFETVHHRLRNQPLTPGVPAYSPAYFDDHGAYIAADASSEDLARRFYRADVKISEWDSRPLNTGSLLPVTIALSWPVSPESGEALGKDNPKAAVTYTATTLTGPDWKEIDPKYVPKIEF